MHLREAVDRRTLLSPELVSVQWTSQQSARARGKTDVNKLYGSLTVSRQQRFKMRRRSYEICHVLTRCTYCSDCNVYYIDFSPQRSQWFFQRTLKLPEFLKKLPKSRAYNNGARWQWTHSKLIKSILYMLICTIS